VQAITDYVHNHNRFQLRQRPPRQDRLRRLGGGDGVCRDYAHLAVAFLRCMNIRPATCNRLHGDIGSGRGRDGFQRLFEVYLGDRWYTFDARNNMPRMARVLIAAARRGRCAHRQYLRLAILAGIRGHQHGGVDPVLRWP